MILTYQDILDQTSQQMIDNAIVRREFNAMGRPTLDIENNLVLLFNLYCALPYFDLTATSTDITNAEALLVMTIAPTYP